MRWPPITRIWSGLKGSKAQRLHNGINFSKSEDRSLKHFAGISKQDMVPLLGSLLTRVWLWSTMTLTDSQCIAADIHLKEQTYAFVEFILDPYTQANRPPD